MSVYVTEYSAPPRSRGLAYLTPFAPLAAYSLSSLSTAPFPQSGANMIRVSADTPSLLNVFSTSTGVTLTSTNSARLAAGSPPEFFSVSTNYRIQAAST